MFIHQTVRRNRSEFKIKQIQYFDKRTLIKQFNEQEIQDEYEKLNHQNYLINPSILEKRSIFKDETYADEKEWRIIKQCVEIGRASL